MKIENKSTEKDPKKLEYYYGAQQKEIESGRKRKTNKRMTCKNRQTTRQHKDYDKPIRIPSLTLRLGPSLSLSPRQVEQPEQQLKIH